MLLHKDVIFYILDQQSRQSRESPLDILQLEEVALYHTTHETDYNMGTINYWHGLDVKHLQLREMYQLAFRNSVGVHLHRLFRIWTSWQKH